MDNIISERATVAEGWEDFLVKYLNLCAHNPYDEKDNPTGYVNLGTAVNNLCNDIIHPKLTSNEVWSCDTSLLQYNEFYGTRRVREVFAEVITEFLDTHEPVPADNLFLLNGVTSCIDLLGHCLADPGEVFLVPTPIYGRVCTDLKQRALVHMWPIHIITENESEDSPALTIEKVINAFEGAKAANCVVRGIFLVNPSNPLGDIYSPDLLIDIMSFCKVNSLHVIVDEVYALSVFSETKKFHSVLKFSTIPDPERTHVLYGLSKDFGIAGLRIGIIYTKCEPLKKCLLQLSTLHNVPCPIMEVTARFLEDLEWCGKYISINQKRLAENFDFGFNYLQKLGLKVRHSSAAFFLWVDFRHLCGASFDHERDFFNYLLEKVHLYIVPGKEFFCAQPGWFRIVFTESPYYLKEGLTRLEKAVAAYKQPLNF